MNHSAQSERSPLPVVDDDSAPHWEGLERGELVLRRCDVCSALNHPAAEECRVCSCPRLTWVDVGSTVRLFSWAVEMRQVIQGMNPPYVIAQVTPEGCDDGDVRLVGTLVADPEDLELGMSLKLRPSIAPGSDRHVATFEPA